ncbi:MAG TPA: MBL fold metallo-hydrolase [Solirubrobacteraceae bacterium]|nr:MBL fold metallo-hydrolase [Solirubrobacteraceae bacterium]
MSSPSPAQTSIAVTVVGGPTALIEYAGLRLLTDPTFDEAPREYGEPPAPRIAKLAGPAIGADEIGDVDVVLLSHDHHPDTLDESGRAFLARAGTVLTTEAGAERLGGGAVGLAPWQSTTVGAVEVTAVPAQHGPDGTDHLTGPVVGFVLRAPGAPSLYVSGDNASVRVVREIAERTGSLDVAVLFVGGAKLEGLFDGALLTLGAAEAAQAAASLGVRAVVPVHQEGWGHFSVAPEAVRAAFDDAGLRDVLVDLRPGEAATV